MTTENNAAAQRATFDQGSPELVSAASAAGGSAQLELSLGTVVGPREHERVAAQRDVADRVAMGGRGGVEDPGALVVASVKLLGVARA
jgi:microcystin degradation protein MlrC